MTNRAGVFRPCWRRQVILIATLAVAFGAAKPCAALPPEVEAALKRGSAYLADYFKDTGGDPGFRALGAYAMFKAGESPDHPVIKSVLDNVRSRFADGKYSPGNHHIYLCAVDIGLLIDIDPDKYQEYAQPAADYLIEAQLPNGGWDYPEGREGRGDTSVTQYACLGLWTAYRGGAQIPTKTWDGALNWIMNTQLPDGAWTYVPGTTEGHSNGQPDLNMTMAALSGLAIASRHAYPGRADSLAMLNSRDAEPKPETPREKPTPAPQQEAGPLVAIDLSKPADPLPEEPEEYIRSKVDISRVRTSIARGLNWAAQRYVVYPDMNHIYGDYMLYTTERTASLFDLDKIGNARWYDDAVPQLLKTQDSDGHWKMHAIDQAVHRQTAFVMLFLARSTGKVLNRTKAPTKEPTFGGGLLTGGKGEPTAVIAAKKEPTPLDQ
ncbi:MAG: terpene cyclase/mutase family protein, partial [Planctomycetaceae bacterium]|nr:terpene cyclase/mutase family protein [Planctomycetaceae bacterium]